MLPLALLLSACAAPRRDTEAKASTDSPASLDARAVHIRDAQGAPAAWADILASAASADIIVIGEVHSHPLGLASAAALWTDILAQSPHAALAMEFFERDQQAAIDDYLASITTEDEFRAAAARTEGNYPPGHRDLIETAKAAGRPVRAANAPRRYVRLARAQGYDALRALTPEQRRLFDIPDSLDQGRYHDDFIALMTSMDGHADPRDPDQARAAAEAMFRSQSLWDATMASSVTQTLAAGNRPVLLIVGRFHSDHSGGTVSRIRQLHPGARVVTLSLAPTWAGAWTEDDLGRADFLLFVGPSPESN